MALFVNPTKSNDKHCFNLVLNSVNTNSYTGTISNANYYVNFQDVVADEYLNRSYKVYTRFKSLPSSNIVDTQLYLLNVGLNMNTHNQSNLRSITTTAVLNRVLDGTDWSLNCNVLDNPPMMLDVLNKGVSTINVQIVVPTMGGTYTEPGFANMTNYIAFLLFEEI